MKQLATLLATLFLFASTAQAQDLYYYSDKRVPIEQAEKGKVVQIPENAQSALTSALGHRTDLRLRRALNPERGFYWLEAKTESKISSSALNQLSKQVPIKRTIPTFLYVQYGDTTHLAMTDEFQVKFKPGVSRAEIDVLNAKHGVEVFLKNEQDRQQARDYNEYLLRVTEKSELNALEMANFYYEHPLTEWSSPNFLVNHRLHGDREGARKAKVSPVPHSINDPIFDEQYYLYNTYSNLGTNGVDIEALPAWGLTTGSSSITVAVIDDGVGQHEDFYSGQVISGYTAGGSGGGAPASTSYHGQACAGIIAANHNSTGVRGVAPNVKIMPIKAFNPYAGDNNVANAIDHAWQNGADVLSNSWGGGAPDPGIEAAIQRARQNGRNEKGSVVVFAAGNNGETGDFVTFPATVPGVLAVGAVDRNNNKESYSPNGSEIDIVAPSGETGGQGDVRTMDLWVRRVKSQETTWMILAALRRRLRRRLAGSTPSVWRPEPDRIRGQNDN